MTSARALTIGIMGFVLTALCAFDVQAATLVGRVGGEPGASATGAATYSIPINVSAGMNGLRPAIALNYDSQSGDSAAGIGWSLSGLSAITRCPLTPAVDGRFQGVRYGWEDRYCLDGQPLILVSGSYGRENAEYRTEIHGYQKITSHYSWGSGPMYFEVRHPNGLLYRYGNDADSLIEAPGTGEIRAWALNEIVDKHQQRIGFTYTEDGTRGEFLPAEIRWTWGPGQTPNEARYRLVFTWEDRPAEDARAGYVYGAPWQTSKRLAAIDYEYESGIGFYRVHRYALSYVAAAETSTQRSQLASVTQCGPRDCLRPTTFQWQDGVAGWASEASGPTADSANAVFGDYDGDGDTDMFVPINGRWNIHLASASTARFGTVPIDTGAAYTSAGYVLDFNGDGRADLLTKGPSSASTWYVYESTGSGNGTTSFTTRNTGIPKSEFSSAAPLDMDGDGMHDLVYANSAGSAVYLRRNTGGAFGAPQLTNVQQLGRPIAQAADGTGPPADFDGDGRQDLLVRHTDGLDAWQAYLSTGIGFQPGPLAAVYGATDGALVMDINADGLSDLLVLNGGTWISYLSTGRPGAGFWAQPSCADPVTATSAQKFMAIDYDSDGRVDLLRPNGTGWRVHRSDGNCFAQNSRFADFSGTSPASVARVASADLNGDGLEELLLAKTSNVWQLRKHKGPPADLMTGVTDGLGNVFAPVFAVLSGWSGYAPTGSASTPTERLLRGGPFTVISQYAMSTGIGSDTYTVSFAYRGGKQNMQGRGFLGFSQVSATDSRNGLVTETVYRQNFPTIGRQELVTVRNGTRTVSVYDPTWADRPTAVADPAGDHHFVHLAADVTRSYEVDPDGWYEGSLVRSVSRTLTWNFNHGAVTTENTLVSAPQQSATIFHTVRTVTLNDGLRSGAWCLGLPDRVDITKDVSGANALTRSVQYTYDSQTCRTLTESAGPVATPGLQLRTSYAYDGSGRTTSVSRSDGNGSQPARQVLLAYDPVGYRVASESQMISGEASHVVRHNWDNALGIEQSRTSVQGQVTSWAHDEFGRLKTETRPVGSTSTSYASCSACWAAHSKYKIRHSEANGYWAETYHDAQGRIVGRAFVLHDGSESRQAVLYDALGRVAQENVPYISGDPVYWAAYEYDLLGRPRVVTRPASETAPAGAVTRWYYGGMHTTITDAEGRGTMYTHDADGRLAVVQAPLGTGATYGYTAFGELSSITDSGGHETTFSYDERGLRTEMRSPDAGTRRYAYNVFGETTSQSDGMSPVNAATTSFDQLGRMTQRVEPEGTTTWAYYTAAGSTKGLLQKVVGPTDASATGFEESYTYDALARPLQTITKIDGTSYTTTLAYDSLGQLASTTYPTTVGWRPKFLHTWSRGYLDRIDQQAVTTTPIYDLVATDASGRVTRATLGNAVLDEQNIYDTASGRLREIRSGPGGTSSIQNYAYAWDRIGNLLQRQDLGPSAAISENFDYDQLNRLTAARRNGTTTLTMGYDGDGDILTKSDVGNYSYATGPRPHAVTTISGGPRGAMSFAYDANGNMTNRNGTTITWTSFNLPKQVTAGTDYAKFTYGPGRSRIKQEVRTGSTTKTIHYVGPHFEVEIQGSTKRYRSNAFAGGRLVFSQLETSTGGLEGYYVLHDHQGSVDKLKRASGAGTEQLGLSFDAWGKRRNANWTADANDQRFADNHWIERGYTGHEHLDNVRLIHMNGRLEDPTLGRMLSPDPVLGNLMTPQALNPYAYVANDPTSYVDPSGMLFGRIGNFFKRAVRHTGSFFQRVIRNWGRQIVAAVAAYYTAGVVSGAYIGSGVEAAGGLAAAGADVGSIVAVGNTLGAAAGGAVAGAIATGDLKGTVNGAISGGMFGGIDAQFGGQYSAGRVMADAAAGGVSGAIQGGSFWQGFGTSGSFSGLTYAALEMREAMIAQSRLDPRNASGISDGFRGDGFKLGGGRYDAIRPDYASPLGGIQGGSGRIFGHRYSPGSFADHLVETFAGPHDFLNGRFFYNAAGGIRRVGSVQRALLEPINYLNVVVAAPFAGASVTPSYAYPAFVDDDE